jgi:hypothetical protein
MACCQGNGMSSFLVLRSFLKYHLEKRTYVLYNKKDVKSAISELMMRSLKDE